MFPGWGMFTNLGPRPLVCMLVSIEYEKYSDRAQSIYFRLYLWPLNTYK